MCRWDITGEKIMDSREIKRRGSPPYSNFVYAGKEMEVDTSVVVGMPIRSLQVSQNLCKDSVRHKYLTAIPLLKSRTNLASTAFADNFLYYVSEDASSFFPSTETKSTRSVSGNTIDPNSEEGCDIDLSEITVDVAAIPQPGRNNIVSLRCRELVLRIFLPLLMLFALPMLNSCKEDDPVTPPTPEPEPQPVIPTKEISIDMTWHDIFYGEISKDTISYYAAQQDVKFVTLQLETNPKTGYKPASFRRARDTLQTRFDISPKVMGAGTIVVSENGAQLPDVNDYHSGMALEDSTWFASHGFTVRRSGATKSR